MPIIRKCLLTYQNNSKNSKNKYIKRKKNKWTTYKVVSKFLYVFFSMLRFFFPPQISPTIEDPEVFKDIEKQIERASRHGAAWVHQWDANWTVWAVSGNTKVTPLIINVQKCYAQSAANVSTISQWNKKLFLFSKWRKGRHWCLAFGNHSRSTQVDSYFYFEWIIQLDLEIIK